MSELDWLALPDDPAPRAVDRVRRKVGPSKALVRNDRRSKLVELMRQLDWDQRLWLRALVKNSFSVRKARAELKLKGLNAPEPYKVSRWGNGAVFAQAREMLADLVYEGQAPTKTMLLLRLDKIAEYNIEEVDEFHHGEPTGRTAMRDVSAALKATEMQGKHLKMFGEEKSDVREGPQLVVQIISAADHTKVVNVTPGRVGVTPLRPGDDDVTDAELVDADT